MTMLRFVYDTLLFAKKKREEIGQQIEWNRKTILKIWIKRETQIVNSSTNLVVSALSIVVGGDQFHDL